MKTRSMSARNPSIRYAVPERGLPRDILHDILIQLPVKFLVRFRCVSKPWLSLIDNPNFVKSHLNRSISLKINRCVVNRDRIMNFYAYELDNCVLVDKTVAVDFQHLRKVKPMFSRGDVVGSVDGIVCLCSGGVNFMLWNPSTQKYLGLPDVEGDHLLDFNKVGQSVPAYGFGYDPESEDYKVVRIDIQWSVYTKKPNARVLRWDVKVFSLKSMSWTSGRDYPHPHRYVEESGRFVSGALHWFVVPVTSHYVKPQTQFKDMQILSFSLGSNEYRWFSQPEHPHKVFHLALVALEGLLGLVCDYKLGYTDVWVMRNYGAEDSWTRLISVDQCGLVRPVTYSKDGGQLLLEENSGRLVWYDLVSRNVKDTKIRVAPKPLLYVESLIQLPCLPEVSSKRTKAVYNQGLELSKLKKQGWKLGSSV